MRDPFFATHYFGIDKPVLGFLSGYSPDLSPGALRAFWRLGTGRWESSRQAHTCNSREVYLSLSRAMAIERGAPGNMRP